MKDKKYVGKIIENKHQDGTIFVCSIYEIKKKK